MQYDDSQLQSICVPNTQTIGYQVALTDATLAPVQFVNYALRRAPTRKELNEFPGIDVVWHVWKVHLGGIVPKIKDRLTDEGTGEAWQVTQVGVQAWGQRFRLLCFLENFP